MTEKRGRGVRLVKVVLPPTVIKEEPLSEDEETVTCSICYKSFASEMALRNHVMMEHFEAFTTNDPSKWTEEKSPKEHDKKKKDLLKLMTPRKLTTLADEGVNYIIVKSVSDINITKPPSAKKPKPEKKEKKLRTDIFKGPFECRFEDSCHQIFFSCCEYSRHYRDEHKRRRAGHRCEVCEKPLSGDDTKPGSYTCEVCAAVFETLKELNEHTSMVHVKLKPFQCEVCQKRFTQQGGLMQHMRMHTGDRPFSCTFCPKAFTQKSGLDQHVRTHTKVKPYHCVVCTKSFGQSVHLKQHMRTHTNVAPFECGVCHQKFKQASHRNYHLRYHNPADMDDVQREIYERMVGNISKTASNISKTDSKGVQVTLDVQSPEVMIVEAEEQTIEERIEQVMAEQSIQMVEADEYVITEVQPWES